MEEVIRFKFYGKLADEHTMDFYEASRFQYSASRLAYKLDSFRKTGTFPEKISNKIDSGIKLIPYEAGCFDISILAPMLPIINEAGKAFISAPISTLVSFAFDRLFRKDEVALAAIDASSEAVTALKEAMETQQKQTADWLEFLRSQDAQKQALIGDLKGLYERILAEKDRDKISQQYQGELSKIGIEQEKQILRMAAPLVRELDVPLRKSASSVEIYQAANDNVRRLLHAGREDIAGINLEYIDSRLTTENIRVIQYNKENGWGKCRWGPMSMLMSFSVEREMLEVFNDTIADGLKSYVLIVRTYIARDNTGRPKRFIIRDIVEIMPD